MCCHNHRTRYRFVGRSDDGKTYYWETGRIAGDSRVEVVRCNVQWFWNGGKA